MYTFPIVLPDYIFTATPVSENSTTLRVFNYTLDIIPCK
jgi:hypothetical protein